MSDGEIDIEIGYIKIGENIDGNRGEIREKLDLKGGWNSSTPLRFIPA